MTAPSGPAAPTGPAGPPVLVEDRDGVRILTMNRPERLNAFNGAQFAGVADAFAAAAVDLSVKVVILTGAGRAFTSGADLQDMGRAREPIDPPPEPNAPRDNPFDRLQANAESFPKPLIAAVNGVGTGLGFTILGYCDFVFVGRSARVRTPFTALGLSPEASSSFLFPLRMGWQNAARALLAGEWFDADDLVACGLALKACEDDELMATALEYATRLAAGPVESLMATKGLMLDAYRDVVARTRAAETASLARLVGSEANRQALENFRNRR